MKQEIKEMKQKQDAMDIRLQRVEMDVKEMREEQVDTADILRRVVKQVDVLTMGQH